MGEVLRLATAMGAPGGVGANFAKLQTGLYQVYGLSSEHYEGAALSQAKVLAAVAAGPCVIALAGDQFNLDPRYQSNHVGHAITVLYPNGATGIQLDPLAPDWYAGNPFTPAELTKFATAALILHLPDPCAVSVKAATDPLNAQIVSLNARIITIKTKVAANAADVAND